MAKKVAQTLANKRAYHIVSIALAHWRDLTVAEQKQHGGNMPFMDFSEYEAMAHEVMRLARDFQRKSEGWDESTKDDVTPAMREELQFDYPAYVDASGVMSVAEAQRLGIGEHERSCTCPLCAGDEPDEPATEDENVHTAEVCSCCGKDYAFCPCSIYRDGVCETHYLEAR